VEVKEKEAQLSELGRKPPNPTEEIDKEPEKP